MLRLLRLSGRKENVCRPRGRSRALAWAGLLGLALPLAAAAANFTVSLDRDTISMGESAELTLKYEGGEPAGVPSLPAMADLSVEGPSASEQHLFSFDGTTSVNTTITTFAFSLTPRKPGTYVIPALNAAIGGQHFTSQPIRLKVAPAGKPQSSAGGAFLKLLVPKNEVYVGEVLPVEFQLYFQAVEQGGIEQPHLNEQGFTLGKIQQEGPPSSTAVNGVRYNVLGLKTYAVAAKVGDLNIGPATISLRVPRATSRDIFGRTFVSEWQPATLESEPQALRVLPLPRDHVPPGFSGAVGNYSMNVSVSPTNVAVGDPLTVKVQISGQGALDNLTLPPQADWQQFKVYPPTGEFQPAPDDQLGISGVKTFALTVVPQSMDIKELPPFVFSFFDPAQKAYRTLTRAATPLIVRPSAASLPLANYSGYNPGDNPAPARDIAPIKQRLGVVAQIQPPLAARGWFLALQGVPALVWLALLLERKRREHLANHPRLRRQRQVEQTVRDGLKELRKFAAANQGAEFFATVFRLLQEQIGERLDLPASAITEAVLEERLRPLGLPEEQLGLLRELFQTCNQARYSPQSSHAEMMSLIPKVEQAIQELRKVKA